MDRASAASKVAVVATRAIQMVSMAVTSEEQDHD